MKTSSFSGIGLALIMGLGSCKKSSSPSTSPVLTAPPVITSINPVTGPYNTIVTISGTGFNATASQDSVWFNGVLASIRTASSTQLTVLVPKKAGTGTVTVRSGGGQQGADLLLLMYIRRSSLRWPETAIPVWLTGWER